LAIGDLNGDGRPDVVTAIHGPGASVSVLLGDGAGGFGANTDFVATGAHRSVAIGDVS
jgi:hypothetical protein